MNFLRDKSHYIFATFAAPDGATVHKANYMSPVTGEEVAVGIKIFNISNIQQIYPFITQLHKAATFDHENIVNIYCSFKTDDHLWVVMSPPGTPIRAIIRSYFRRGLPEDAVAVILRETLKAVHYMHEIRNEICGKIGAECVCLDDECRVKIGVSWIGRDDRSSCGGVKEESGIVTELGDGESKGGDVLRLGLLALELFYGEIPSSGEIRSSLMAEEWGLGERKQEKLRGLRMNVGKFKVFSCFGRERRRMPGALAEVVAACLSRNPATTSQLMEFRYFQTRVSDEKGSLQKLLSKR